MRDRMSKLNAAVMGADHLDCLETIAVARRTSALSVLCPSEPAEVLRMHAIPNVGNVRYVSCELDLYRLEPQSPA